MAFSILVCYPIGGCTFAIISVFERDAFETIFEWETTKQIDDEWEKELFIEFLHAISSGF